jgi:hypothetical protein
LTSFLKYKINVKTKLYITLFTASIVMACSKKQDSAIQSPIRYFESPAATSSGEPFLFTYQDSLVYLSWVEKKGEEASFKFSKLQNERWTTPSTIASGNTWFVNWADYPMIARNDSTFIAHFLDKSGDGTFMYDVKFTTSKTREINWTEPKVLHDDGKQAEHGFVSLQFYDSNFFVTWLDGRNTVMEGMDHNEHEGAHHGNMSLRAAVLDAKGSKLNEWELDNRTCDCCQTSAALTSNGPVVVYRDRSDDEIRDMSIVRFVNGQWTEPKTIHNDNWKIAGCPVNGPRISALGNDLAVAWFTAASDTSQVKLIFSNDAGETFGKPIRVDKGSAIGRVDIVMLDNQHAAVSWMEGTEIRVTKVSSNGDIEPSVTIATSSQSRSSGFPQMTKSGQKLIFAWTDDKEKTIKLAQLTIEGY